MNKYLARIFWLMGIVLLARAVVLLEQQAYDDGFEDGLEEERKISLRIDRERILNQIAQDERVPNSET